MRVPTHFEMIITIMSMTNT